MSSASPGPGVCAVVGAGRVGCSWALLFARAGYDVRVWDAAGKALAAAPARIATSLDELVAGGVATAREAHAVTGRISCHAELGSAVDGDVDHVQECIVEDLEAKRDLFAALAARTGAGCVLASSTATFPMTEIARELDAADRCVVAHPALPPHLLPIVEIVPGARTSAATVERTRTRMVELGQRPVLCRREIAGFVLNRLQFALLREAYRLVHTGTASVADIDACVTEGLGMRWPFLGPLAIDYLSGDLDRPDYDPVMRSLMDDVGRPFDGPDRDDVARVRDHFDGAGDDAAAAALAALRDRMLIRLRDVKS